MTINAHGFQFEPITTPHFCNHCRLRRAVVYLSYRDQFRFRGELLFSRVGGGVCKKCLLQRYSGEVNELARKAIQSFHGASSQANRPTSRRQWLQNQTVPA